jgi:adenylate kinase
MIRIILLGAPGAGKGSQAALIKSNYGIPHISTGEVFRQNIANKTELGKYAQSFMDRGELVPDDVVIDIVAERLKEPDCKNGFILDGFPRTISQAKSLENITEIDYVINIEVDFALVIGRLAGRRMCNCGEVYHISSYQGVFCKKCGGLLYQREDDKEETVRNRLAVYERQTSPLIEYYKSKNILYNVDGNSTVLATFKEVQGLIKE